MTDAIMRTWAIVSLLMLPVPAGAEDMYGTGITGNEVMKVCDAPDWRPGRYDPCGALLLGIIDGLEWGDAICRPYGVTNNQVSQLAYDAVRNHPEIWDKAAGFVIKQRLAALYPCPRKR